MKRFSFAMAVAFLTLTAAALSASEGATLQRAQIARVSRVNAAAATSFSAEVPVVARVQGTAFFRSSIDINNNTNQTITVQYQFSYTCVSSACSPVGGFYRTPVQNLNLLALQNFHQDDLVDYLNGLGLLQGGAEQGTIGTLLVTFSNVTAFGSGGVILGSEATVVARTYNHLDESTASSATVGFAYNASLFFESADTTLVGTARDTKAAPSVAGKLRSNVGVRNTDINATGQNVTVVLTFYDVQSGQKVGTNQTFASLQPGEVRQISDLWATAGIPSTVNQVIIFVDNPSASSTSPTFEGYVNIVDGGIAAGGISNGVATQDASFFEMKCADMNLCGN
ncbi:MAG TPA: hypothetical protein VKE50_03895 [Thermoanaerobaculia bacterium]|nr:hypothetical protein [Thermoanaerobaculia bacterium]